MNEHTATPQQIKKAKSLNGEIYCVNAMKLAWVKLPDGKVIVINNYGDKVSG